MLSHTTDLRAPGIPERGSPITPQAQVLQVSAAKASRAAYGHRGNSGLGKQEPRHCRDNRTLILSSDDLGRVSKVL